MQYPEVPLNLANEDYWNRVEFDIQKKYFSHIVYCRLSDNGSFEATPSKNNVSWVEHHLKNGYPDHDPAVHVGRYGNAKQIWRQVYAVSPLSKKIMSERKSFGMTNGITIPIRDRHDQNRAWFTLGGRLSENQLLEIYLDPNMEDYFRDLHIKISVSRLMKKTTFNAIESKILILSDYHDHLDDIANSTGTNPTYVKDVIVEAYRAKSIRSLDVW